MSAEKTSSVNRVTYPMPVFESVIAKIVISANPMPHQDRAAKNSMSNDLHISKNTSVYANSWFYNSFLEGGNRDEIFKIIGLQ